MIGLYNFSVATLAGLASLIVGKIIWSREKARKLATVASGDNTVE